MIRGVLIKKGEHFRILTGKKMVNAPVCVKSYAQCHSAPNTQGAGQELLTIYLFTALWAEPAYRLVGLKMIVICTGHCWR